MSNEYKIADIRINFNNDKDSEKYDVGYDSILDRSFDSFDNGREREYAMFGRFTDHREMMMKEGLTPADMEFMFGEDKDREEAIIENEMIQKTIEEIKGRGNSEYSTMEKIGYGVGILAMIGAGYYGIKWLVGKVMDDNNQDA